MNSRLQRLLSVWLLLSSAPSVLATQSPGKEPDFLIETWSTGTGLPQSSVTSLVQTRDGYLWFGTFNGLVRFDGVNFKIFTARQVNALGSGRIVKVFEDSQRRLWIGREEGGFAIFQNGTFRACPEVVGKTARSMTEDGQGSIWITTTGGHLIRHHANRFEIHLPEWELGEASPNYVCTDGEGRLWLGTDKGIAVWDGHKFVHVLDQSHLESFLIEAMLLGSDGLIWVAANGHVRKFADGNWVQDFGSYQWEEGTISSISEDRKGQLWIGTYGSGVYLYSNIQQSLQITRVEGLSQNKIRALCEDREGNMWVGTDGGGLNRLAKRRIELYRAHPEGLTENTVLAVSESRRNDGLWIGTNGAGLNYLDLRTGEFKQFARQHGLLSSHIWTVHEDAHGVLWIGTWGGGLYQYRNGAFVSMADAVSNDVIFAIHEDAQGTIWIGTQHGLGRWREGIWRIYGREEGLLHDEIRCLADGPDGTLWIGTNGGGLYQLRNDVIEQFKTKDALSSQMVWALHVDSQGVLWVGTFGNGLIRISGDQVTRYSLADGLWNNVVCGIREGTNGNLWISSYDGIFQVNRAQLEAFAMGQIATIDCQPFGLEDGLSNNECAAGAQNSICLTRNGQLWFGTVDGLACLNTEPLPIDSYVPPVLIEQIAANGKLHDLEFQSSNSGSHQPSAPIVLPPGTERLEIRYTALSFAQSSQIRFKYRLSNIDEDWIDAGPQRTAHYTGLKPGAYQFHVAASTGSGSTRAGASLNMVVLPFFWQTLWFKLCIWVAAATALTGGTVLAAQRQMRQRLLHLEQQNALERERVRIAQDIHDDLGARLTEMLLLSDLAHRHLTQPRALESYLKKLSTTARELVRNMEAIVWAVNPRNDDLENLVTYISGYAERYLSMTSIRCRLELPDVPLHRTVSSEFRHNLLLIVKEAVHNIVKHSEATEARLTLTSVGSELVLIIADNGKGFRPGESCSTGGGNGLANMTTRVHNLGGVFQCHSRLGEGAQLEIRLPLP